MNRPARWLRLAAASLAAVLPFAGSPATPHQTSAVSQQMQRDAAKPERSAVQSLRLSRRMGPLGLPAFARPGLPPWIDSAGNLLRAVR